MVYGSDKDQSNPFGVAGEPLIPCSTWYRFFTSICFNATVFVQAAAGVVLTGVGYYSLFKSDKDPNNLPATTSRSTLSPVVPDQEDVVRAIDKEAQKSSNNFWKIKKS